MSRMPFKVQFLAHERDREQENRPWAATVYVAEYASKLTEEHRFLLLHPPEMTVYRIKTELEDIFQLMSPC